jgi:hypothetical protein
LASLRHPTSLRHPIHFGGPDLGYEKLVRVPVVFFRRRTSGSGDRSKIVKKKS